MNKLNTILLIDDDPATNFLHKLIIKKEDCTENIICIQSAKEALDYLKTRNEKGIYPHPEMIFLDINMPGMNGWEFLNEYEKNEKEQKAKIVVMLTTSLDPEDKKKADNIKEINRFISKPLTSEKLREVLKLNFPDIFRHF
ncbi:MAG: response regulator [Flavobacteriaceae bacterium]|nr:response regulator [Flavobacteriaceae bacterium]